MTDLKQSVSQVLAHWDAQNMTALRVQMELLRHAVEQPPSDTRKAMEQALKEYLRREMPAGTIIGDPDWWAAKITRDISLAQGVETDTTRLEFMQFYGAQVCWGNDSEVCDVRWHTHWGEQELRRTSNHNDWRVAIDEAIEMEKKP